MNAGGAADFSLDMNETTENGDISTENLNGNAGGSADFSLDMNETTENGDTSTENFKGDAGGAADFSLDLDETTENHSKAPSLKPTDLSWVRKRRATADRKSPPELEIPCS